MNIVTINDGKVVTTSLAIAHGTENDHASVIKLVRSYQADMEEFGPLGFEIQKGKPLPQGGFAKATEYAILNEQQSTLLLTYMRNSDIVRAFKKRLVKEFWAMAEQLRGQSSADPMTVLSDPAAMRGLLLTYTEKVIALEEKVAEQAPKVEALDRIATADGSLCFTDAAKTLQIRLKDLIAWLSSHKWIYQRPGTSWIAYQDKIQSGYIEHKTNTVERSDGTEKVVTQARITPKGLAKLAEYFGPGNDSLAVIAA